MERKDSLLLCGNICVVVVHRERENRNEFAHVPKVVFGTLEAEIISPMHA
jgi:hypothetical protein